MATLPAHERTSDFPGGELAPARPVFPAIDGLRAVAALTIVGTHAAGIAGLVVAGSVVGRLAARLEVGVAIFFVISGFVLYRPFAAAHLLERPPLRLGAYAVRRLARIVPAYWVALAVIAVVTPLHEVGDDPLRYFLFGQIYHQFTIGFGMTQAWSLCVEVSFYVALPLWATLVGRLVARDPSRGVRIELVALLVLAVASLCWTTVLTLVQDDPAKVVVTPLLVSLPGYLDEFALGMALAVLSVSAVELGRPTAAPLAVVARRPWIGVGVALAAFLLSAWCIAPTSSFAPMTHWQFLARHVCYEVVGAALVATAVVARRSPAVVPRLLASRPLVWLGLVSYGLYLWHDAVMSRAVAWGIRPVVGLPGWLWWPAIGLIGGTALAALSWYLLERPVLRLAHRAVRGGEVRRPGESSDEPALLAAARAPEAR